MWVGGVGCVYKHEHYKNGIKKRPKTLPRHTTPVHATGRAEQDSSDQVTMQKNQSFQNAHSGRARRVRHMYTVVRALWDLVGAIRSPTVWSQLQKKPVQPAPSLPSS